MGAEIGDKYTSEATSKGGLINEGGIISSEYGTLFTVKSTMCVY